jgi:pilus assembly protein CpaE
MWPTERMTTEPAVASSPSERGFADTGLQSRGRPLTVELIGTGEIRAQVEAVLAQVTDPPLVIAAVSDRSDSYQERRSSADITMVIVEDDRLEALSRWRSDTGDTTKTRMFAVLRDRSSATMRRALQEGADELLLLPLDIGNLTRALLNISEARRKADRDSGGIVYSVTSNTGGVGVTSLVGSLGLALRRKLHKNVAFFDLHMQAGALSVFLNMGTGPTIMNLSEGTRALDSIKLESALSRHSGGAYLLAAPNKIEESELVPQETISGVVSLMRQLFDFILVDCGSYIDSRIASVWECSDRLFYVVDHSIIAARGASRFIDVFDRLGIKGLKPEFILSKYSPDHPITETRLAEALNQPIFATIPCDVQALDRVHITGTDLWNTAPGSPLTKAIEKLAIRIACPDQRVEEVSGSLLSRLLSGKLGSHKSAPRTKKTVIGA